MLPCRLENSQSSSVSILIECCKHGAPLRGAHRGVRGRVSAPVAAQADHERPRSVA
jgi:hypothetical protein